MSTPAQRVRMTEYLEVDLATRTWRCARCDRDIGPADGDYKRGLLLHDRDPRDIHPPRIDGPHSFAPDPGWCRIVEYCCPGCGVQMECEYLPPGHPLTRDIEVDVDALAARATAAAAVDEEET